MTNVVIGAGSGMGVAIARRLASRGRLLIADRNLAGVEQLAKEIGGDVHAFACDVTDQAQIDSLFAEIGELDALVHTAGVSSSQAPGRRILDVNLAGPARVLRAAEALLRPGTVGIVIASQSGYMVPEVPALFAALDDPLAPDFIENLDRFFEVDAASLAYQISKRGVHRMVRRAAAFWGARGARILSVSPGINDTPMNRSDEAQNPIMLEIIKSCPLGRRGTPEEIANVISFVTSAGASYMTGSDVLVDGGMVTVLPTTAWHGKLRSSAPS
jgi:NAD(P)-dependent dehydrogenase (short-subunit alcohol dehydrogenase family)